LHHPAEIKLTAGDFRSATAHDARFERVASQAQDVIDGLSGVVCGKEQPRLAVDDQFRNAANGRGDGWHAKRHALEDDGRTSLLIGKEQKTSSTGDCR
jgi:hypothetical protein